MNDATPDERQDDGHEVRSISR